VQKTTNHVTRNCFYNYSDTIARQAASELTDATRTWLHGNATKLNPSALYMLYSFLHMSVPVPHHVHGSSESCPPKEGKTDLMWCAHLKLG
jgi:hypothetical protein